MFGGTGKGGFVRTRISTTERALSWLVVALLAAVGVSVYLDGQSYDESLFGLDPTSLASATPSGAQGRTAANTIVVDPVGAGPARAEPAAAGALAGLSLAGWSRLGEVETFTPATLYEKINGRAEQYISYDVVGLASLSLTRDEAPAGPAFIDLYVYDMGTPERGFGIYSVERDPEAAPADLGRRAYRSGASFFIWHGRHYVQALASAAGQAMRADARRAVAALLAGLPDPGTPVAGLGRLPAAGMVPGSEKYYQKNAMGFGFLAHTWSADYRVGEAEVTIFLATPPDAAGADAIVEGYRGYLTDFGADITASPGPGGGEALFGDMDGYYDVLLRRGRRVAGAALLDDRALAERIAADFLPPMVAGE